MQTRWLCLEFTQTVGWEAGDRADDALTDYGALVDWAEQKGALAGADAYFLRGLAQAHPAAAARVLARAVELRRAIYRLFAAIGAGRGAAAADLARLNEFVPESFRHLRVEPAPGGAGTEPADDLTGEGRGRTGGDGGLLYRQIAEQGSAEAAGQPGAGVGPAGAGASYRLGWVPVTGTEALGRAMWPLARSAVELLTSPALERLKLCEADDCGWLFVDASRNRSRRWCDMSGCGNLAKVRRFRARRRGLAKDASHGGRVSR